MKMTDFAGSPMTSERAWRGNPLSETQESAAAKQLTYRAVANSRLAGRLPAAAVGDEELQIQLMLGGRADVDIKHMS